MSLKLVRQTQLPKLSHWMVTNSIVINVNPAGCSQARVVLGGKKWNNSLHPKNRLQKSTWKSCSISQQINYIYRDRICVMINKRSLTKITPVSYLFSSVLWDAWEKQAMESVLAHGSKGQPQWGRHSSRGSESWQYGFFLSWWRRRQKEHGQEPGITLEVPP